MKSRASGESATTKNNSNLVAMTVDPINYEEPAAIVEDPDDKWAIDPDVPPLVNILTFGWTEGAQDKYLCGIIASSFSYA